MQSWRAEETYLKNIKNLTDPKLQQYIWSRCSYIIYNYILIIIIIYNYILYVPIFLHFFAYDESLIVFLNCKSLWIKASAKWINVNVFNLIITDRCYSIRMFASTRNGQYRYNILAATTHLWKKSKVDTVTRSPIIQFCSHIKPLSSALRACVWQHLHRKHQSSLSNIEVDRLN